MASEVHEEESLSQSSVPKSSDCFLENKSRTNVAPSKSLVRFQDRRNCQNNSRLNLQPDHQESLSSTSRVDPLYFSLSRERYKAFNKIVPGKDPRPYSNPKLVGSDCWRSTSGELPVELVDLVKEDNDEEDQLEVRLRKQRLSLDGDSGLEKLSYTKEFHVLTEVQKGRILTAVEDAIKRLANNDLKDLTQEEQGRSENRSLHAETVDMEKYFCRKFLLPWVIMKVMEMVICHVIQLIFLSNDLYFQRKNEFLPVVVTYYLTLFIIIISLVMHIVCYSQTGFQNPCYFMCVISSSILTLTTVLGILIMLCSMEYYRSFREILVLVFVGVLLCSFVVELCICYMEVKSYWTRLRTPEQYYIS